METENDAKTYGIFSTPANQKIINELETKGAKIYKFSPVGTEKVEIQINKQSFCEIFAEADWIIFQDFFAVDYFLSLLEENGIDLFELDEKNILAAGEAVADRLRFALVHSDVIPNTSDASDTLDEILNYSGKTDLNDNFFILPTSEKLDSPISKELGNLGAKILEMSVCRTIPPEKSEVSKLKTFLRGGMIDEFVFSMPEEVFYFRQFLFGENLNEILNETIASAINEITIQTLRENQIRPKFFTAK